MKEFKFIITSESKWQTEITVEAENEELAHTKIHEDLEACPIESRSDAYIETDLEIKNKAEIPEAPEEKEVLYRAEYCFGEFGLDREEKYFRGLPSEIDVMTAEELAEKLEFPYVKKPEDEDQETLEVSKVPDTNTVTTVNSVKTEYLLFGGDAVAEYFENDDIEDVIRAYEENEINYEKYAYVSGVSTPLDLINAYNGQRGFAVISKEEFDRL